MSKKKGVTTVRFSLSRPLTWAEREAFRGISDDVFIVGYAFDKGGAAVTTYSTDDSREVSSLLHNFLATEFVNVYIKSIRTINPKVKV